MSLAPYLTLLGLFMTCQARTDLTLKKQAVGAAVVESVVDLITESCVFDDDALFLRRIAFVETMDGHNPRAFERNGTEFYGGIWQIEKEAYKLTKQATDLFPAIEAHFGIKWEEVGYRKLWKPLYSGLAARIYIHMIAAGGVPRSIEDQAMLWADQFQKVSENATTKAQEYIDMVPKLQTQCEIPRADLVFVLDASTSIELGNFILMKEFVASVVEAFDVGQDAVRVGIVTYSSDSKIEFDLEAYTDKAELLDAIRNTEYLMGKTNSAAALRTMSQVFTEQGRGGQGVPEIGIFMTDGKSQDAAGTARAADEVHAQKLTVFSIGMTDNINKEEVERIGTDPDCVHVYYLKSFLDVTHFARQIERQDCKAPAELKPGEAVMDQILMGSEYHFKTKVDKAVGATVLTEMVE